MCYLPFKALGESLWLNFEHSGIKEAKKSTDSFSYVKIKERERKQSF